MELTAKFLKAVLGLESDAQAQEILDSENAEQQIKELNAANLKRKLDEGDKKGRGMASKDFKKAMKNTYGVDVAGETPDEMLESLKESVTGEQADEVSEDTVKAHPAYKALLDERLKAEQKFNKEVEKKVNEKVKEERERFDQELKKTKKSSYLTELEVQAKEWLVNEGAILHSDPEKQKKQIQKFVKEIAEANDLDKDSEGKFLFSKDGNALTNSHGHNATVQDLFRENDYMFSYQKTQQRQSSGLDPNGSGGGQRKFEHFKDEVPKNEAEFNALRIKRVNREITPEAFKEAEAAYEASKTA